MYRLATIHSWLRRRPFTPSLFVGLSPTSNGCVRVCVQVWGLATRRMDWITSSSAALSGSYVTMTKEQVRRLARQLPPHDADARHCHGPVSDDDKRRLENFRDLRYRDALGQGNLGQLEKKTVCRQVCAISGNSGGGIRVR